MTTPFGSAHTDGFSFPRYKEGRGAQGSQILKILCGTAAENSCRLHAEKLVPPHARPLRDPIEWRDRHTSPPKQQNGQCESPDFPDPLKQRCASSFSENFVVCRGNGSGASSVIWTVIPLRPAAPLGPGWHKLDPVPRIVSSDTTALHACRSAIDDACLLPKHGDQSTDFPSVSLIRLPFPSTRISGNSRTLGIIDGMAERSSERSSRSETGSSRSETTRLARSPAPVSTAAAPDA